MKPIRTFAGFPPSAVDFFRKGNTVSALPLVGCLGRSEIEFALAMLVRACQVHGNRWQALTFGELKGALLLDPGSLTAHLANPFLQPDFGALVQKGYATWIPETPDAPLDGETGKSLALTDKAIETLRPFARSA